MCILILFIHLQYIVRNALDERIMAIQEQKRKLTDCAFNFKKKSARRNIDEIRILFGL
jgi:SNF2 family DNA or RNA helicase